MRVEFHTQREYKDKQTRRPARDARYRDQRQRAGGRDYEMYSGGEAFRINFAIRLALSEVLAQRAGGAVADLGSG